MIAKNTFHYNKAFLFILTSFFFFSCKTTIYNEGEIFCLQAKSLNTFSNLEGNNILKCNLDTVNIEVQSLDGHTVSNTQKHKILLNKPLIERRLLKQKRIASTVISKIIIPEYKIFSNERAQVRKKVPADRLYLYIFLSTVLLGAILLFIGLMTGLYALLLSGEIVLFGMLAVLLSAILFWKRDRSELRKYFGYNAIGALIIGLAAGIFYLILNAASISILELLVLLILFLTLLTAAAILFGAGLAWLVMTIVEKRKSAQ